MINWPLPPRAFLSLMLLLLLGTAACSTSPINSQTMVEPRKLAPGKCPAPTTVGQEQCFAEPQDAPPGKARLYVFRPDFSDLEAEDAPTLVLDDSIDVTIRRLSYAPVDLDLGKHRFVLTAATSDSEIWNLAGAFDLTAPGRYYLAIWNSDTAYANVTASSTLGKTLKQGAAAAAIGAAMAVATGGIIIYPISRQAPRTTSATRSEARFEVIEEKDALEFIRQCSLSAPTDHQPQN